MKTQIPKTKYKAAIKIFNKYKNSLKPPNINQELRILGLSDKEIEIFWKSNSETRIFALSFEDEQRFLHSVDQYCYSSIYEDSYPFVFEG